MHVTIRSSLQALDLNATARGLHATRWRNLVSGRELALRGPELDVELDATETRLWITGWRGTDGAAGRPTPDQEDGFRAGWQQPEFDDAKWTGVLSPAFLPGKGGAQYYWARTHLFVPVACTGKALTLVLGGIGMYDFRYLRVFLNGRAIRTRRFGGIWHDPVAIPLGGGVRLGQDNVIALPLADPLRRTAKLDALELRQYPGATLAPGATWRSMEAVYGTGGRPTFLAYVRSRMRRVRRGHDKAYALYESFASWKLMRGAFLSDKCSEQVLLDQARKVARAQHVMGAAFDAFHVEFWVDPQGDVGRAAPDRFPQQFRGVRRELDKLGLPLGLWLDSSQGVWSIGANPTMTPAFNSDPADVHWRANPDLPARCSDPGAAASGESLVCDRRTVVCHSFRCSPDTCSKESAP